MVSALSILNSIVELGMGLKVRRAAKSGTGLQFNEDVLLTEDLQKNCTPVPDFTGFHEVDR